MKYVKSILVSIFISVFICLGIMQIPDSCINECQGEQITVLSNEQHINQVISYEVVDNHYIINGKDPQIIFHDFEHPIASIYVEMSDLSANAALFELYISKPGEVITEEGSIKKLAKVENGKAILAFDIPLDYYGEIRMDMNTDFTLDKFEVGDQPLKCYSTKSFSLITCVFLALFFEIVWLIYDFNKKKNKVTTRQFVCNCVIAVGGFVLFFIVQYFNIHMPFFSSDEGDNFSGGMLVALGADVYSGFTSQHMPLMYYICSIFALFGAKTVFEFRVGFYVFMSVLWVLMVFRYRKQYGLLTMMIYPVLYICAISATGESSTTVLAEQVQAQGLVILMLEFLIYIKEKVITKQTIIWVSLAVFLAFGTAFVSAFSICPIVVYVLVVEIRKCLDATENHRFKLGVFWKNTGGLILGVLSPFLVLIIWYLLSGNLYNAYYGAYVVNTKYYSQYYPVGGSVLDTLINPIDYFVSILEFPMDWYLTIGIFSVVIVFAIMLWKRRFGCAITLFLCLLWSGTRGFVGFHSLPYHGLTMILLGVLAKQIGDKIKDNRTCRCVCSVGYTCVVVALVFFMGKEYLWANYDQLEIRRADIDHSDMPFLNEFVCELTEPGEYAYFLMLDNELWMDTELLPAAPNPVCKWIYDAYQDEIIMDLEQKKPKIIVIPDEMVVWGYRVDEYAKDIYQYVAENYDKLDVLNMYLRKEDTEKERAILNNIEVDTHESSNFSRWTGYQNQ